MSNSKLDIETTTVHSLITKQFPQWKDLPISPVAQSGWDNRTFHLGEEMLIRMPSSLEYVIQVEKEQKWLPKLAPLLPLQIPVPLAMGQPSIEYPWKWSIYRWIKGEPASCGYISNLCDFASSLAHFLQALQFIDARGAPLPGKHSFYRGGSLTHYESETRQAIRSLHGKIDTQTAVDLWEKALVTTWQGLPVWIHGDISSGNLLVQEGKLSAVIDFGQLAVGDPACDLAIAWTLFSGESRETFRETLKLDEETWARGRAWTLWKALVVAANFTNPGNSESAQCWHIIDEVLADHRRNIIKTLLN